MAAAYEITPLAKQHDRASFACGEPSLDDYLKRQVGQDVKRDLAACYALTATGSPTVLGYYTLSASSIQLTDLPPDLAKKAGRYQLVPAILLGRLALDAGAQGQSLGELLLLDALRRVLRTGVGVKLVVVDALHERAAAYYAHYGFQRLEDAPLRLFLPVSAIRALFPEEVPAPASSAPPAAEPEP